MSQLDNLFDWLVCMSLSRVWSLRGCRRDLHLPSPPAGQLMSELQRAVKHELALKKRAITMISPNQSLSRSFLTWPAGCKVAERSFLGRTWAGIWQFRFLLVYKRRHRLRMQIVRVRKRPRLKVSEARSASFSNDATAHGAIQESGGGGGGVILKAARFGQALGIRMEALFLA